MNEVWNLYCMGGLWAESGDSFICQAFCAHALDWGGMKVLLSFLAMITACGCALQTRTSESDRTQSLYLHFFLVSPPRCVLTTKIHLGEDFDVQVHGDGEELSGRIETREGKFFVHALGSANGTGIYEGEAILENLSTQRVP
jgi:hypothetical protein